MTVASAGLTARDEATALLAGIVALRDTPADTSEAVAVLDALMENAVRRMHAEEIW